MFLSVVLNSSKQYLSILLFSMVDQSLACGVPKYSLKDGTACALKDLLQRSKHGIPDGISAQAQEVEFYSVEGDARISTPCPFKETEAVSALKAVEAAFVAAITDLRYGAEARKITIDFERAVCFLFAAYICEIDGMNKAHPNVKSKLIGNLARTAMTLLKS